MTKPATDRLSRAEGILVELGFPGARVITSGPQLEIASVSVGAADWERAAGDAADELANRLKSLGFRYVAIDLEPRP